MIQKIIDGIIKSIQSEYDDSYEIYTESTKQGLKEPCFSILSLNPSGEREISDRFKRYFPFSITYFPSSSEPIAECNEVCETLLGILCDITTDIGVIHAKDMSGEVIDGNLQFKVQYDLFVLLQRDTGDEGMVDVTVDTTTLM